MKSPSHQSTARQALCVATVALMFSAAAALAQTGQPGATSAGSSQKNPPASSTSNYGSTTSSSKNTSGTTGSSSSTQNADIQSTADINAQSKTTGAGAMTGRETTSKEKLSWGDRHFINKTADDGRDEVALAQLATERASNPEVKSFAQKLVDDHTKVNDELKQMASEKNVKIDEDNDHDRTYKRLAKKSGTDFDREFVEHMVDDHEKTIKAFEKASKDAKDADVRSFASKHLDDLREHLQAAQSLRQSVVPTGRMDTNGGRSTSGASSSSTSGTNSSADKSSSNYGTGSGSTNYGTSADKNAGSSSTSGSTTKKP